MPEAAIPGAAVSAQISAAAPLEGFAALHREHDELRRWFEQAKAGSERGGAAGMVREFLRRAAACGATLSEPGERNAAKAILDYWYAELVGLPQPRPGDFQRLRLAKPSAAGQATGAANAVDAEPGPESRELIRLAATARLWRDSGERGFLLSGDALDRAAKFHGVDSDIDSLVQASRRQRRKIWIASISAAVGSVAAVLLFLFGLVPFLSNRAIDIIKDPWLHGPGSASVRSHSLWQLGLYQPLRPPFDLSGDYEFEGVKVPGLKLNAPNFSSVKFNSVDFHEADLQAASFSESQIKGTKNNLEGAKLDRAQFSDAWIEETSFAGAKLYRATFDRGCLRNVNFSDADLRDASFWNVTFDDQFERNFENSPWWLAEGWNSHQIERLSLVGQSGFKWQSVFETKWQSILQQARQSAAGEKERADALNQIAWNLAAWGAVRPTSARPPLLEQTCSHPTEIVPENALAAAENGVCILLRLKESGKDPPAFLLPNLQDTRAYVLLQSGHSNEAAEIYREDVIPFLTDEKVRPFLDVGGAMFRAAVAYQTIGDSKALELLELSNKDKYVPTHEMNTLKSYIGGDFKKLVYEQIDRFHPSVPPPADCK